jgi:hypothetical protein
MRTFSQMSIPDLEITREGYEAVKEITHKKIQQLEKEISLESTIKPFVEKFKRAKELQEIVDSEIFNQKQE